MIYQLARQAASRVYRTFVPRPPPPPAPPPGRDSQLNVYNFQAMLAQPADRFDAIQFDPNNDCNINCVYCHNHRSKETIATEDLRAFVGNNVTQVKLFQFGCVMEPTLDRRLADLMHIVAQSPAKPTEAMMLQSNGLLLNLHDPLKMRDAGLSEISVSVDSADPGIQKSLRGGMKLDRVLRNVEAFRTACPDIPVTFIATVTAENIGRMDEVVRLGLDSGVKSFVLREVFYVPENNVVDHERMPALLLKPGQFAGMRARLEGLFRRKATFLFANDDYLANSDQRMRSTSFR